jgi:hypothetical protein
MKPLIPFASKMKKAEGAEIDKAEHIKLKFFIDPRHSVS